MLTEIRCTTTYQFHSQVQVTGSGSRFLPSGRRRVPPASQRRNAGPLPGLLQKTGQCSRFICSRSAECSGSGLRPARRVAASDSVAEISQGSANAVDAESLKQELRTALEGLNRGVFGVPAEKQPAIRDLISQLEVINPIPQPTQHMNVLAGTWQLLYSTVTILGPRRTKLGLRNFVSLGRILQIVDIEEQSASNVVEFAVTGLGLLSGNLSIDASYTVSSPTRVDIKFNSSDIMPAQLRQLFEKNYELLLSVFNPEGWLEITYVDEDFRIGHDQKGNIFVVEKVVQ